MPTTFTVEGVPPLADAESSLLPQGAVAINDTAATITRAALRRGRRNAFQSIRFLLKSMNIMHMIRMCGAHHNHLSAPCKGVFGSATPRTAYEPGPAAASPPSLGRSPEFMHMIRTYADRCHPRRRQLERLAARPPRRAAAPGRGG